MAHVGDSRAVLCAKGGVTRRLCEDHLAGRPDELDRIEASGGLVVDVRGVCRVNGVLAVSRAIGDIGLKDLVIANPDVCRVPLTGGEEFLLIASDGVWDVLSDEESVHMVRHILFTHEKSQEGEEEEGMEEKAAKSIIACAWDRGSTDDMSVIVVNLIKYRNMCSKYDHQDVDEVVEQIELDSLRIGSSDDGTSGSDKADSVGLLINR